MAEETSLTSKLRKTAAWQEVCEGKVTGRFVSGKEWLFDRR
jgi:hypothetical protein